MARESGNQLFQQLFCRQIMRRRLFLVFQLFKNSGHFNKGNGQAVFKVRVARVGLMELFGQLSVIFKKNQRPVQIAGCAVIAAQSFVENGQIVIGSVNAADDAFTKAGKQRRLVIVGIKKMLGSGLILQFVNQAVD